MLSIGQKLRAERERQGIELETVAQATKIRKLYLIALEEDDLEQLPPRVYATGFVANYARYLGLDAEGAVREFKAQAYGNESAPATELAKKRKVRKRVRRRPGKNSLSGRTLLAAIIFLIIVWFLGSWVAAYITGKGIDQEAARQAPLIPLAPAQTETTTGIPEVRPEPTGIELAIVAREDCWLEVSVDGIEKYSGMMAAGEQYLFPARESIFIRAGNAGGIDLSLNNQKLAPLGAAGQVVEKEFTMGDVKSGKE